MKTFYYYGIDADGNSINGNFLAFNKTEAENKLNKRGIIVQSIRQKRSFIDFFKSNQNG